MIRLSDRLQAIADKIELSETVADIGTDHGFLPIHLRQTGKSPAVILTDVSEASLAKAEKNREKFAFDSDDGLELRTGNGLTVLNPYEVDTVVIAGMGGKLIESIMEADLEHTCSFKKFILQPRIGQGELRKWLCDRKFAIINEELVWERENITEILTVLSPSFIADNRDNHNTTTCVEKSQNSMSDAFAVLLDGHEADDVVFRIPPWIVDAEGPVEEFLDRNIKKEKEILKSVMLSKKRKLQYEQELCADIYYLKGLLKEYIHGR